MEEGLRHLMVIMAPMAIKYLAMANWLLSQRAFSMEVLRHGRMVILIMTARKALGLQVSLEHLTNQALRVLAGTHQLVLCVAA